MLHFGQFMRMKVSEGVCEVSGIGGSDREQEAAAVLLMVELILDNDF